MPFFFFRAFPLSLALFSYFKAVNGQGNRDGAKYGSLSSPADIGLEAIEDSVYTIDIVLGGQNFTVMVDTGSTDLWVNAKGLNLQPSNVTDIEVDFSYAVGEVKGNIAFADLQIGPYFIPNQVFVNATEVDEMPGNILGLIGMAFDTAAIAAALIHTWGLESAMDLGRAPMTNLIAQDPEAAGYFDLQLGRQDAQGVEHDSHFLFGQHITGMEAVASAPKLERVDPNHWTIALDGMNVNGKPFTGWNKSKIAGVPEGKVAAVLDSGFTYSQIPAEIIHAIYSSIPGAVPYSGSIPGTDNGPGHNWIVPCNASANVSFVFAGQEFPLHPLDVVSFNSSIELDKVDGVSILANSTVCLNRLFAGEPDESYDILLGMGFLRNVYASFQYGNYSAPGVNVTGQPPFVQLLSATDQDKAWSEFSAYAARKLASGPPAVDPKQFVKFLDDFSSASDANCGSAPGKVDASEDLAVAGAASGSSGDSSSRGDSKYGPVALGLLGANIAVGLAILGVTLTMCLRGAKDRREAQYKPIRLPKEGATAYGTVDAERGALYGE